MIAALPVLFLLATYAAGESVGVPAPFIATPADGVQKGPLLPYEVRFEGITQHEEALEDKLREVSNALRLQDRPTATRAGLDRRAEDDVARFTSVLRSFGFHEGTVTFRIETPQDHIDEERKDGQASEKD